MSILVNFTSVIFLITWTNFHPTVGINWKQRILTTVIAIWVPELPALVAIRDFILAHRLWVFLRSNTESKRWKEGWTLEKSFLVVKGGICVRPHYRNRLADQSNDRRCKSTKSGNIVDPQTFLWLACVGGLKYMDFPSAEEIQDKSKADWFAKTIAVSQLLWTVINIGCRDSNNYTVSLLENMMLEWIVFGVLASALWWRCPKGIEVPYHVPVRDYSGLDHPEPAETSQSDLDQPYYTQGLRNRLMESEKNYDLQLGADITMVFTMIYIASAMLFIIMDIRFFRMSQHAEDCHRRYVQLEELENSAFNEGDTGSNCKWRSLAKGMGLYTATELNFKYGAGIADPHNVLLKVVVVAVFITTICQFARLVIALTAYSNAPRDIYDVPKAWILEVLLHFGG
ncbi:hypothetical protein LA080_013750 [Diaporthe eres]|nr:hypothetical protein LA080_013750 [Diaporthe eres]